MNTSLFLRLPTNSWASVISNGQHFFVSLRFSSDELVFFICIYGVLVLDALNKKIVRFAGMPLRRTHTRPTLIAQNVFKTIHTHTYDRHTRCGRHTHTHLLGTT